MPDASPTPSTSRPVRRQCTYPARVVRRRRSATCGSSSSTAWYRCAIDQRSGMLVPNSSLSSAAAGPVDGVAPGAERHEQLAVRVEREVAVHHRRDADRAERRRVARRGAARVGDQVGVRGAAVPPRRRRASTSTRGRRTRSPTRGCRPRASSRSSADQAGLDAGRAELDAEDGTAAGDEVVRHCASSPHRRPSNGLRTSYHLPAGHRRGNRVPIRTRRATRVSRAGSLRFLPVRRCPSMPVRLRTTPCWSARPSRGTMRCPQPPGPAHPR